MKTEAIASRGAGTPPAAAPARRPVLRAVLVLLLLALAAGGFYVLRSRNAATSNAKSADGSLGGAQPQRPVPVLVAPVEQRDLPIWLEGLGNVTAFYTITVKSQVDGRLTEVRFQEGAAVQKGDVLAQIDPRPFAIQLHQAEAVYARDLAQLKNARVNLGRYTQLSGQNLIPKQQATDQQASVDQLDAQVRADQAAIESAKLSLDYARITSPVDGVTGVRLVDPGNLVRASDAGGLVVVTQIDPIAVYFTVPEDDLPAIQKGMAAGKLSVEAMNRDGSARLATGTLEVIDNQINQATATVRLKALFENKNHVLWPNQFVKARLLVATRKAALVVPAVAVQHGPKGTFAYVVAKDGKDEKASARPIEVDVLQGEDAIIAKGLAVGERVVIDGQSRLKPGSKVAARSAGKAEGGKADAGKARP